MQITTISLDEIRETYFYDVLENVTDEFPTVNRACLLMAAFDGRTEDLAEDLWGLDPRPHQQLPDPLVLQRATGRLPPVRRGGLSLHLRRSLLIRDGSRGDHRGLP